MASIADTFIPLNIEHLDRVLSELEHFADAEWKSFGLKCGLHYNTLKAIERDAGSTKECFTECVACWLMMKDNVSKKGKPTLERLADIVEKIGDKATAKKIRIHNGIVVKGLEIHQVTQSVPINSSKCSTLSRWFVRLIPVLVIISLVAVYMAWAFNPTVNSPIDEYALKLREKYNKTLTRYKDPDINKYPAAGPTAPVVPFISLKLIRLKSYQKKADAEFLHSVDKEILEHDNFEKIKIDDILKPLTGKSTLAKELALQWAERTDKLLNNFKIIILIPLRLEIYQKAENIEDLLIYVEDIDMVKITSSINRARGAEVLWILDGFDELPHHLRNSSTSIFIKLIKGDILPKSTVIVTSRHAATDRLLTFLEDDSKHIVLRGFGPNEILEYVSKYFKNEVVLFEFQSHYSGNTVIENMLYNPMNCFIMCKIFTDFIHTKNNKYPITMTAIYNYYVRVILKRHLIDARVSDINYEMPQNLIREIDFNIPELIDIWEDFYFLSKVAYNGVMKQEYVFGKELHNVLKLSMMDTISSFTGFDKDESSSFIHTTLQDYLAAIYLVNNPGSMFTEIDMKQNSNLEDVFIFYVGLSKHIDRKIGTLDMLRTNVFRDSYNLIYLGISSLLLRCLYENYLLLHNQDYNLVSGHTWSIANVPLNNFDYFIAGYIAAAHNITLRINVSHATQLTAFKKGLQFQQNSVNGKINIRLHYLDFSKADPVAEVNLPSDAVIGLNLMLKLDINSICQLISKFPLLEELLIVIYDKFDCYSTISEHPLMKLKELERLAIVIMTYNYKSILELLKQFVVPRRPLKHLVVVVPLKIIDIYMYREILDLEVQRSLDLLRIQVFIDVIVFSKSTFKYTYGETLEFILNKETNSLTFNYYQLFVHLLGATHKIQLSSFTSYVYYKVKEKMVYRLAITIYSEPVTSSLNKFISAFVNFTSKMNITTNFDATDYINHTIKLNGSMYAVVLPGVPVPYIAETTVTDYRNLDRNILFFFGFFTGCFASVSFNSYLYFNCPRHAFYVINFIAIIITLITSPPSYILLSYYYYYYYYYVRVNVPDYY
ncbi:PREDICTED: uncharacterized protein LOC109581958 [Amphimedon queenslandica]|uniref:NACHT domain-containing protein n=1 Tax=Amphimedon queenslandica TaxID=400682 RepID=A0AAN0J4U2_AMPQE|nr:PREDICTED: uncharacterized protein LOC109581958 [Amphimedon queenslandica]|eukprot:XP_019852030.1 PREDICTED: uncharacterized protein LOC109581958 [Amphimedon queenslandica]